MINSKNSSQRVQEDTIKIFKNNGVLGTSLIEALMILVEFYANFIWIKCN